MDMDRELKRAIMVAHNNTHSVGRIYRNVKLIRELINNFSLVRIGKNELDELERRLEVIERASNQCQNQVDELYNIIKDNTGLDGLKKSE